MSITFYVITYVKHITDSFNDSLSLNKVTELLILIK